MECLWCLLGHWQQDGYRHDQNPPVFYVCLFAYNGLTHYHLYGAGFLAQYAKVYPGLKEKSLVLSLSRAIISTYGYTARYKIFSLKTVSAIWDSAYQAKYLLQNPGCKNKFFYPYSMPGQLCF